VSLEISEIFRRVFLVREKFKALSPDKARVVRAITSCRTVLAGLHLRSCTECGNEELAFNSCSNRHCPKCQGGQSFRWVQKRCSELLPVPYFHLVFTLPSELRTLCYQNKRLIYDALLKSSAEAIQDAARTKFKAEVGSFTVLHTWNQELSYHPHAHHVVPACGFSTKDGKPMSLPNTEKFFISTKVLSPLFRGKFISRLKELYSQNQLRLYGSLKELEHPGNFNLYLAKACRAEWVVYAKRPFASPEAVIKYLASYIHRVGISSKRLLSFENNKVTFLARCRKDKSKKKPFTLTAPEFCRRFLMHLLPKGFKRVRYFGFLRNHGRLNALKQLREFLNSPIPLIEAPIKLSCPNCNSTKLNVRRIIKTHISRPYEPHTPTQFANTS
jgi:hypothetical protein